jgi:hypothetical protein
MKPVILFKHLFSDVAISVNILVSGLAITIAWFTGIASKNLFHIIGSLILGLVMGLIGTYWEIWRFRSNKTKKQISFIPHITQGILLVGILLVPLNEVRFYSIIVYFGYHIILLFALLFWQRQARKRFQLGDLFP